VVKLRNGKDHSVSQVSKLHISKSKGRAEKEAEQDEIEYSERLQRSYNQGRIDERKWPLKKPTKYPPSEQ
jgi:hypothetical protein